MAGETIVFFPKYTALTGSGGGTTYYSDPYDMTGYKTLTTEVHHAGGTPSISGLLEQSSDLISWSPLGSALAPSVGTSASATDSDPARYVRMAMTVTSGSNLTATLWAKAVSRDC